ncbi:HD11 [Hepatospora eriocheir]|uniref:HD11 n=1 Tax=Hepatospora eriocheir TaxID=1081669 RepID=A0A1X0QJB6_9MICR|nr:HD11 [Hepatospora eriocheir]ORD99856.1 HD11 [Hepatospora eriocheir]
MMNNIKTDKEFEALIGMIKLRNSDKRQELMRYEKVKKTRFQIEVLNMLYNIYKFPSTHSRKDLGLLIALPQRCIQVWFQNTRQANKKRRPTGSKRSIPPQPEEVPISTLLDIIDKCQIYKNE